YRAEMIVWILTTTMPLVMLALWTSVAAEAPFQQFTQADFVAYYLGALVVRNLTSNWVAWQLAEEIRTGTLSMRLLRPVHPLAGLFATQAAAVPLRAIVVLPVVAALALSSGAAVVIRDPAHLGLFVLSLAGAWLLTFFVFVTIGALSFFLDKSMSLAEVYFGLFMVLSGYLVPLALMPRWLRLVADWLPFRYMLGAPLEILTGRHAEQHLVASVLRRIPGSHALLTAAGDDLAGPARLVAAQWAWVACIAVLAFFTWRRGLRRFEAFGA
ncbi:MAG TPA: ABC-2 family transporter protein, partial [Kofleriaceae bacterium]|nr:ABC-2 family transporter protein [Kofleriaceae bacterium]